MGAIPEGSSDVAVSDCLRRIGSVTLFPTGNVGTLQSSFSFRRNFVLYFLHYLQNYRFLSSV